MDWLSPLSSMLVDTDLGADDAVALMLALAADRVQCITTVFGNVPVAQATTNVGRVLDIFSRSHPKIKLPAYYQGAAEPLLGGGYRPPEWPGHGQDGLGDHPAISEAPHRSQVSPGPAADAILRFVSEPLSLSKARTILALGPLTNLAHAIMACGGSDRWRSLCETGRVVLVWMGGTSEGRGNTGPATEFNMMRDPEAARIVLESFPNTVMVPWELTTSTGSFTSWLWHSQWTRTANSAMSEFFQHITTKWRHTMLEEGGHSHGHSPAEEPPESWPRVSRDDAVTALSSLREAKSGFGCTICDAVATAVAVDPSIVSYSRAYYVTVELAGEFTRGATIIDWYGSLKRRPNVTIIHVMDAFKYRTMLDALVVESALLPKVAVSAGDT